MASVSRVLGKRTVWVVAFAIVAGCSSSKATSRGPTSSAAGSTSAIGATATDAPTTTSTTTAPTTLQIDSSPCTINGPTSPNLSEVTFVKDGKLFGIRRVGNGFVERCLAQLTPSDNGAAISWGPQGDRFLIGNRELVVHDQRSATDFGANDIVTWSAPKGTAILSLDPTTHQLAKRDRLADGTITTLPVMAEAYDAIYHPAGRNIAVVGRQAKSSPYGIWLITNDGRNPKLITAANDAKRVRLLYWGEGGRELTFWAEHPNGDTYVHTLTIPGLVLSGGESAQPVKLVDLQRNIEGAVVTGDCASRTLTLTAPGGPSGHLRFPIATRDARLLSLSGTGRFVATRTSTCDGPEDLWVWPATGAAPFKIAEGVSEAVMRTVAGAPFELPDDITARAPA